MRIIVSTLVLLFVAGFNIVGAETVKITERPIVVIIDGFEREFNDQHPIIENGRTLVPLRGIFEYLGGNVNYNSRTKHISAQKGERTVELTLGSTGAIVNGKHQTLDVVASTRNGRTMVPLRFIGESLGADVKWENTTRTVYIESSSDKITSNDNINNNKNVTIDTPIHEKDQSAKKEYSPDDYHPDVLPDELTEKEKKLAKLINEYRESLGLEPLKISKSLTTVARYHVWDSNSYHPSFEPYSNGEDCNLHSWSDNGEWDGMCYTPDHAYKELTWSKPSELTNYTGNGFEISASFGHIGNHESPELALRLWQNSSGHNDVIIGNGRTWAQLDVMGIGIDGAYAHVWFGKEEDPEGYYELD